MMQISAKLMLFSMCFSFGAAEENYWPWTYSGCPAPYYHYPHHEDGKYVCAAWWDGEGADWPVDACNGDIHYTGVGDYDSTYYYPMGSIYVYPGCTMYLYDENGFAGNRYSNMNDLKSCISFLTLGRQFMVDLFQTINIFQIVLVFLDQNHTNADVTTQ